MAKKEGKGGGGDKHLSHLDSLEKPVEVFHVVTVHGRRLTSKGRTTEGKQQRESGGEEERASGTLKCLFSYLQSMCCNVKTHLNAGSRDKIQLTWGKAAVVNSSFNACIFMYSFS